MGEEGLKLMRDAADKNNMLVVSEVMDPSQIALMLPYVDVLQVGARNMQNYHLLRGLGEVDKPVLLKRGMSATIEELLLSAEYIMAGGNYKVILCERGIRTFDTYLRNTLDIAAIPVLHSLSHLPVVADPSHGTGRRDKVAPMARAAVAAGADGLIIEVHPNPERALSDGVQSLYPDQFAQLMKEIRAIAPAVGRHIADEKLSDRVTASRA
jgi:3-deoxy-7-phosphoheptulonate synthase